MLKFGPEGVIEFTDKAVAYGYSVAPGQYVVEQIDLMPPSDYVGQMRILGKVYADHFVKHYSQIPALGFDGEGPLTALEYYIVSMKVMSGSRQIDLIFPLKMIDDIVSVKSPGFVCPFSLHTDVWIGLKSLNLVEYPSVRVNHPVRGTIVALSARKEIGFQDDTLSMHSVWRASLLTERNRYLSVLRYTGVMSLEQYIPLVEKTARGITSYVDIDHQEVYSDRFADLTE